MRRFQLLAAVGVATACLATTAHAGGPDGEGPPWAKPGQCFAKVATQEVWETTPERELVTPERVERRLVPAEFGYRDKTVVVRPAYVEHYPVPATYRNVAETVVVRPATTRLEVIPATYDRITRQVLVREARTVWKPGRAVPACCGGQVSYALEGYGRAWDGRTQVTPTGEVMCLVYEPALYRDVTEEVVRTPERRIEVSVPAETRLETRQVIDHPAYEASREIGAQYGHVREKYVVSPEHEETHTVEAVYRTVEKRRLVSPSRTDWRQIACAAPPAPPPCVSACTPRPHYAPRPHAAPRPRRPHATSVPRPHHHRHAPPACNVCAATAAAPGPVAELPSAAPPEPRLAADGRPMTARLQAALAGRGYYKGPVDGRFTQPTHDALVAFQRKEGFAAQGELTRETAGALGLRRGR